VACNLPAAAAAQAGTDAREYLFFHWIEGEDLDLRLLSVFSEGNLIRDISENIQIETKIIDLSNSLIFNYNWY